MVEPNEFLEMCKARFAEAQRRFNAAQQALSRAQQEFGAAQVEFNNWQGVLNSEMRRVVIAQHQDVQAQQQALIHAAQVRAAQIAQAVVQSNRASPSPPPAQASVQPPASEKPVEATPAPSHEIIEPASSATDNKTELVRELLAQHPEGMTPAEIWHALRNHVARAYVYSILKRLKDADEIIYLRRRKKYSLRVVSKSEEVGKEAIVH
jgi:hypothetical protein